MILFLLGAILSLLAPALIYKRILKGKDPLRRKRYTRTFLLAATLYTLPIIVLEVTWDVFFGSPTETSTVTGGLADAFLRAALLEEAVKYFFTSRLIKRSRELDLQEVILLAGLIGIGYGFTEKLAYFDAFAQMQPACPRCDPCLHSAGDVVKWEKNGKGNGDVLRNDRYFQGEATV